MNEYTKTLLLNADNPDIFNLYLPRVDLIILDILQNYGLRSLRKFRYNLNKIIKQENIILNGDNHRIEYLIIKLLSNISSLDLYYLKEIIIVCINYNYSYLSDSFYKFLIKNKEEFSYELQKYIKCFLLSKEIYLPEFDDVEISTNDIEICNQILISAYFVVETDYMSGVDFNKLIKIFNKDYRLLKLDDIKIR